jgi:hypothetical protein
MFATTRSTTSRWCNANQVRRGTALPSPSCRFLSRTDLSKVSIFRVIAPVTGSIGLVILEDGGQLERPSCSCESPLLFRVVGCLPFVVNAIGPVANAGRRRTSLKGGNRDGPS